MEGVRPAEPTRTWPIWPRLAADAVAEMVPAARRGDVGPDHRSAAPVRRGPRRGALADPDVSWCWRAPFDGVIVGYAVARLERSPTAPLLAVIEDLFTEPEARSVGVGEAMLGAVVEWGTERGAVGIDAMALPGARDTKNFFETFGLKARALVVHRDLP